ncbi:MAG: hypothetical protein M0Z89_10660 [Nitrospiraceae bacterium]|nr:hypothetical protein [Nitrospiraceae bacterium]
MKLLDQFISQTGKQPSDWTSQDIQKYLNYVKEQVMEASASGRHDDGFNSARGIPVAKGNANDENMPDCHHSVGHDWPAAGAVRMYKTRGSGRARRQENR